MDRIGEPMGKPPEGVSGTGRVLWLGKISELIFMKVLMIDEEVCQKAAFVYILNECREKKRFSFSPVGIIIVWWIVKY